MRHRLLLATVCAGAAAGTLLLPRPAQGSAAPPLGPLAIVHMHRDLFAAIDRGDAEAASAFLSADVHMDDRYRRKPCTVVLGGVEGIERHAVGHTASASLFERWAREAADGAETQITSWVSDCDSGELSFATLELQRTTGSGAERATRRYVSTSLVTYDKGNWKLTHLHLSPAPEAREASVALEGPAGGLKKKGSAGGR